jgi:hypothetical protein
VRIGRTFIPAIVNDGGSGATLLYATSSAIPEDLSDEWAAVVDVDWADTGTLYGAELSIITDTDLTATKYVTHPTEDPTELLSCERIPVAWFRGRTLLRDDIHGVYTPQIWTPS